MPCRPSAPTTLSVHAPIYPTSAEDCESLLRAIDRPSSRCTSIRQHDQQPLPVHGSGTFITDFVDRLGPHIPRSCHAKDIVIRPQLTLHLDECLPGEGNLDIRHSWGTERPRPRHSADGGASPDARAVRRGHRAHLRSGRGDRGDLRLMAKSGVSPTWPHRGRASTLRAASGRSFGQPDRRPATRRSSAREPR